MNPPTLSDLAKPAPLQSLLNDLVHFVDRQDMSEVADLVTFWLNQARDETWKVANDRLFTKDVTANHKTEIRKYFVEGFKIPELSIMYNLPESKIRTIVKGFEPKKRS